LLFWIQTGKYLYLFPEKRYIEAALIPTGCPSRAAYYFNIDKTWLPGAALRTPILKGATLTASANILYKY